MPPFGLGLFLLNEMFLIVRRQSRDQRARLRLPAVHPARVSRPAPAPIGKRRKIMLRAAIRSLKPCLVMLLRGCEGIGSRQLERVCARALRTISP